MKNEIDPSARWSLRRLVFSLPKRAKQLIGAAVAAVILLPLAWQVYQRRAEVEPYLVQVDYRVLLMAFGLAIIDLGILAFNWMLIARRLEIALGLTRDLRAFFVSNFAKRVPGMVWYVLGRAYLYRVGDGGSWMAASATVLENALLLFAGMLLGLSLWPQLLGSGLALDSSWLFVGVALTGAAVVLFSIYPTAIWRLARLFKRSKGPGSQIEEIRLTASDVPLWIALYGLVWIIGGFSFHLFVAAFYPALPGSLWPKMVGVSTMYSLSGFIAFLIPAGMGVKELVGGYLLGRLIPLPLAIATVILFRLFLLSAEGFWLGLSYLLNRIPAAREGGRLQ